MISIVPNGHLSRSVLHIAAAMLLCTNNLQALGQDRTSPAELQVRGALELGIICSGCGVVPLPQRGRKNSSAEAVSTPETAIADITSSTTRASDRATS
jgi:hypothetical protein